MFSSIKQAIVSAVELAKNRLDLAVVEWEEERLRLIDLLIRAAVVAVLGVLTLVSATVLVVVVFWEYAPRLTLLVVTLAYAAGAALGALGLRRSLRDHPKPFGETRAALRRDVGWLKGGGDHD